MGDVSSGTRQAAGGHGRRERRTGGQEKHSRSDRCGRDYRAYKARGQRLGDDAEQGWRRKFGSGRLESWASGQSVKAVRLYHGHAASPLLLRWWLKNGHVAYRIPARIILPAASACAVRHRQSTSPGHTRSLPAPYSPFCVADASSTMHKQRLTQDQTKHSRQRGRGKTKGLQAESYRTSPCHYLHLRP